MAKAGLPNGIELEYEVHGELSNPVILPILGVTDNITDWPAGLYEPLVDSGFCVIRHELRDSGFSTKFDAAGTPDLGAAQETLLQGEIPPSAYTMHDVAADTLALMEHLKIQHACVVGYSYGAAVAQLVALRAPKQVSSLVCLQGSNYNAALPPREARVNAAMAKATTRYDTVEESIEVMTELRLTANGSRHAMSSRQARTSAQTSVGRMFYPEGTARIVLSRMATRAFFEQTAEIICPTLILHADEDPIFALAHGEDMTARIPGSELVVLNGAGHNHPESLQPIIARHLLDFALAHAV